MPLCRVFLSKLAEQSMKKPTNLKTIFDNCDLSLICREEKAQRNKDMTKEQEEERNLLGKKRRLAFLGMNMSFLNT
jgi:hypothetical protein